MKSDGENSLELKLARLELANAMALLNDKEDVEKFFSDLFTQKEIRDLALRWRIFQLLHEGVTQREIASRLGVSLCKVTRGSRFLKREGSIVKAILTKKETENENRIG